MQTVAANSTGALRTRGLCRDTCWPSATRRRAPRTTTVRPPNRPARAHDTTLLATAGRCSSRTTRAQRSLAIGGRTARRLPESTSTSSSQTNLSTTSATWRATTSGCRLPRRRAWRSWARIPRSGRCGWQAETQSATQRGSGVPKCRWPRKRAPLTRSLLLGSHLARRIRERWRQDADVDGIG
eukprot:COSAG04_NODE_220_length_19788_cov_11.583575_2_plen_183_part_00